MNFTQHKLGNGVRLHLCETDKFKSLTCKVFIQQDLKIWESTSTALVPLLLRRGSQKFPSTRHVAQELEDLYAAEFGADVLKIGERQILELYFQMVDPSYLPQGEDQLERGLNTFWELVTRPYGSDNRFFDSYFEQEKHTMEQELKGLVNDKRSYALARFVALMCAEEPFGIYKYGDLETLRDLENEEVYKHYQRLLHNYPLDIFVVGSNLERVVEILSQSVAERDDTIQLQEIQRGEVKETRYFEETMDVQQSILAMGYRTNRTYLDHDYYALLVGNGILGGFAHSKLFTNVREKASLAYYVGSNIEGSKGLLTINAGISGDQEEQAIRIIKQQVEELQTGNISVDELEQTKRGLAAAMSAMNDSPTGLIDRNLIGIVHDQMRTIDQVVEAIWQVEHDDVVRVMEQIELDTTYILRSSPQEGVKHGAN
ncbi:MAG: insulinase family protein [Firmicutes bacterium]|nr:insulinase family protein [Bacillota bacterium]